MTERQAAYNAGETEPIKHCPYCGEPDDLTVAIVTPDNERRVTCLTCGANGPLASNEADAIMLHNAAANALEAVNGELERVRNERDKITLDYDKEHRRANMLASEVEPLRYELSGRKLEIIAVKQQLSESNAQVADLRARLNSFESLLELVRAELATELEKNRWIPVGYDAVKVANFWMHVKKTDYCWEWTGSKNACGYGTLHDACAHQISYRMFYGEVPAGEEIMHTCNNPACVNPGHLVSGTHKENMHYMFKLRRYSRCGKSSKYIGVSYRSDSKKWRAVLSKKSLGCFEAEVDAAKAYDKAAIEYYGAGAAINLPPATEPPEEQHP